MLIAMSVLIATLTAPVPTPPPAPVAATPAVYTPGADDAALIEARYSNPRIVTPATASSDSDCDHPY